MNIIECSDISYKYGTKASPALKDISLKISEGELVAILGHNGCGKSTLAKHFNALLRLQNGRLTVAGTDASDDAEIWKLRRMTGMVFQNPDNQFVSSIIEEDVAFGLENYMVERERIPKLVASALEQVEMSGYEKRSTHVLSGGQKQRIALAGVLALDPDILIFDEATAMLDPDGRRDVLSIIKRLHDEKGKTIIMITHYIEESIIADRIILMNKGRITAQGSPHKVLANEQLLAETGLEPPIAVHAWLDLKHSGYELPYCPLTEEELVDMICR